MELSVPAVVMGTVTSCAARSVPTFETKLTPVPVKRQRGLPVGLLAALSATESVAEKLAAEAGLKVT